MNAEARVLKIVAEISGFPIEIVKPDSVLESDLQCDSLDRLELVMALEDEFECEIDDAKADNFKTVQEFIACIREYIGEAA